jgi:hypothetical protein
MVLYSYVLRYDDGVAPNPFYDYCTLAVCKPVIRKNAKVGDWVIGTGSKDNVNRDSGIPQIIYAMEIEEITTLTNYFEDYRFKDKKPNIRNPSPTLWTGDNFYYKQNNEIHQLESVHSNPDGFEDIENKNHDLKGVNVLISKNFWYWGRNAKKIPKNYWHFLKIGQGHKKITKTEEIVSFEAWIKTQNKPSLILPCQPLCRMYEDGCYEYKEGLIAPHCFRDDCKWDDCEEIEG